MGSSRLFAHLQLTRPANVVTAIADIWAGFAIAGAWDDMFLDAALGGGTFWTNLVWLSLSTIGLYAGGVAFNDVFDAELDAVERPERPIPSGRASRSSAAWMAFLLLVMGVAAAAQVSWISAGIALAVALLAVLYDYWGKHQFFFGPINMGLCRSGNLLLGISVSPLLLEQYALVGLIPLECSGDYHDQQRRSSRGRQKSTFRWIWDVCPDHRCDLGFSLCPKPGILASDSIFGIVELYDFPSLTESH